MLQTIVLTSLTCKSSCAFEHLRALLAAVLSQLATLCRHHE